MRWQGRLVVWVLLGVSFGVGYPPGGDLVKFLVINSLRDLTFCKFVIAKGIEAKTS